MFAEVDAAVEEFDWGTDDDVANSASATPRRHAEEVVRPADGDMYLG